MFAVCSVSFPVASIRSALGSLYRRKTFAKKLVWNVSRVHSLTHGWVSGGRGERLFLTLVRSLSWPCILWYWINDLRKQWRIWKPFARNYLSCLQKISSNGMVLRTTYSGFWPCIWKFSLINFALATTELVLFSRFKTSLVTSTTKRKLYKFKEKKMQTNWEKI